jgi:hypothetical protein
VIPEIPGLTTGELKKLVIKSYSDDTRQNEVGEFEVMFNPTTYSKHYEVVYNARDAQGSQSPPQIFSHIQPQVYNLEFLFDGTETVGPPGDFGIAISIPGVGGLLPKTSVKERVAEFLELTFQMDGSIHRPRYLILIWGDLISSCIMTSADIDYTLFKPDGDPLRAKVRASFTEDYDETLRVKLEMKRSPDLTHVRLAEENTNLSLMSYEVYKEPSFYIQVARTNKLKHFRRLRTGQQLIFPPVRNQSENA